MIEGTSTIPVKPADAVARDARGRPEKLEPMSMFKPNCSTTLGFAEILVSVQAQVKPLGDNALYSHVVVDIDLYMRYLKYVYSAWKYFPAMRVRNAPWQGVWHIVKKSYEKIWEFYFLSVIAPAYRSMLPEGCIVRFAKHATQVAFISDLSAAYKRVRRLFLRLYESDPDHPIVLHIQLLFEYLLPMVHNAFHTRTRNHACLYT